MEQTESIKNIGAAILNLHKELKKVAKTGRNPFFNSSYAPLPEVLESIREPLHKVGLTYTQFPTGTGGLTTTLIHPESGEWMRDTFFMEPSKKDPQGYGSVITYQRRYALGAILGLNIDDDDGNQASAPPQQTQKAKLNPAHTAWPKAVDHVQNGKPIEAIEKHYLLSPEDKKKLLNFAKK